MEMLLAQEEDAKHVTARVCTQSP